MNLLQSLSFPRVAQAAWLAFALALPGAVGAQAVAPALAPAIPAPTATLPAVTSSPTVAPASPAVSAASSAEAVAAAASPAAPETFQALDTQVQDLKQDVLDLNRDLFMLEEELLFPANTQVAVFLSLDVGTYFQIDSVQLRLDDKQVANYLYTEREVDGLNRGGVQRLYLGNVRFGQHELVAFFTGKGPQDRDYRRGATITFRKGEGAKFLELRVSDRQRAQQPEFVIKEWE